MVSLSFAHLRLTIPSRFDEDDKEASVLGTPPSNMSAARKTNKEYSLVFFSMFPRVMTIAKCLPSGENTANPLVGRKDGYPLPPTLVMRMASATVTGRFSEM